MSGRLLMEFRSRLGRTRVTRTSRSCLMQKIDALIAVAGWEQRFLVGMKRNIELHRPSDVIVLAFSEYLDVTEQHRTETERFAKSLGSRYVELQLPRDPVEVWKIIRESFSAAEWLDRATLVDITTMPREVIYWAFSFLRSANSD